MKRLLLFIPVLMLQSCAFMFSKNTWPVTINSTPEKSEFVIKDRNDKEVSRGTTPATINLKSSAGFFKRAKYAVTISNTGFAPTTIPVKAKLNGWYFGNLAYGGVIGMLIFDPISGNMFKIKDPLLNPALAPLTSQELKIIPLQNVPEDLRQHLVLVKD